MASINSTAGEQEGMNFDYSIEGISEWFSSEAKSSRWDQQDELSFP